MASKWKKVCDVFLRVLFEDGGLWSYGPEMLYREILGAYKEFVQCIACGYKPPKSSTNTLLGFSNPILQQIFKECKTNSFSPVYEQILLPFAEKIDMLCSGTQDPQKVIPEIIKHKYKMITQMTIFYNN